MITLAKDCLLFHLSNGETVPFSADMISIELAGESARWFDPELASQAAKAVFHYFKNDLARQSVTAEEFSQAMEKALRGVESSGWGENPVQRKGIIESDLRRLASDSADAELLFFPRLRAEVREHLRQSPRLLRYHGLRECVKQIAGARRWSSRCRDLQDEIVDFVRECAGSESGTGELGLVVE